jgi:acyl carrier protein
MSSSLAAQVKEVIIRELNLQDTRPDDIADDVQLFGDGLGLDSLDALQLAMALEEHFDVKIPEGDAARPVFRSVATIVAFIEKARAQSVE